MLTCDEIAMRFVKKFNRKAHQGHHEEHKGKTGLPISFLELSLRRLSLKGSNIIAWGKMSEANVAPGIGRKE
ncbi:hypothetical protein ALGA_1718 [Labilibaculum antarcticum]|uniref:Uncharacterized protein n=1 Tax=Labilibaculum antarcticum TaxID=1717717 RepID=A0A1Y1CJD0_9BACT|nr:hypothetical protein ALGA_1718 [Labilibaculum antarcticum]